MNQLTEWEKKQIESLLLQNHTIEAVSQILHRSENSIRGVWSGCKKRKLVSKDAKPGQIPGMATPSRLAPRAQAAYPAEPLLTVQHPSYGPAVPPGQAVQTARPAQTAQAGSPIQPRYDTPDDWLGIPPDVRRQLLAIWENPKNRIMYDFFKKKFPQWDGDFADCVCDALEYMFKGLGYELVVRHKPN